MTLYFLSILAGIHGAALALFVVAVIGWLVSVIEPSDPKEDAERGIPSLQRYRSVLGRAAVAFGLLSMLTPTPESLTRAYLMREGAQVFSAESVHELGGKMDKLIEAVGEHTTVVPASAPVNPEHGDE